MFMFIHEAKRIKKYFCIFNFFVFLILQVRLISPIKFPSKHKETILHEISVRRKRRYLYSTYIKYVPLHMFHYNPNSANASFQDITGGDIRSSYSARRILKTEYSLRYMILRICN